MKNWLHASLLGIALAAAGCSSSSPPPRYAPGAPGQWGGDGARAGGPWQPPPPAPAPPSSRPPTLIDTALDTIDILIKPPPRRYR